MKTRRKTLTYEVEEGIIGESGWKVLRVLTYKRRPTRSGGWQVTRVKSRRVGRASIRDTKIVFSLDNTRYPGDGL